VYAALLIYLIYPYADYDWGWHYRYGEYLFTHGQLLRHDIYSWTMPGYEWVNHSWLYDPFLYILYNQTGSARLLAEGGPGRLLRRLEQGSTATRSSNAGGRPAALCHLG
jgi:hypothetical protein